MTTPGPTLRANAVTALVLLLVALSPWLLSGLDTLPHGDGWILRDRAAAGAGWLWLEQPTRMFIYLPWRLVDLLSPSSFLAAHLLLIGAFWVKGLAFRASLARVAPGLAPPTLAAALLIVYPASTLAVSIDASLDRHVALAFFLVAVWLFVRSLERPSRGVLAGMWAAQIASLWSLELVLPLALLVPLGLLWSQGRLLRSEARRAAVRWLALPLANLAHNIVHILVTSRLPGTPLGASHAREMLSLDVGLGPAVASVAGALTGHLIDPWPGALASVDSLGAGAFVAVAVAMLALTAGRLEPGSLPSWTMIGRVALAGAIAFAATVVPMSLTLVRFDTGRSWILSSLGATLILVAAAATCARLARRPGIARAVLTVVVALATVQTLAHHLRYVRGSDVVRRTLASIVELIPTPAPDTVLAVLWAPDAVRPPGLGSRSGVLTHAVRFIYDDQTVLAGVGLPGRLRADDVTLGVGEESLVARFHGDGRVATFPYRLAILLDAESPDRMRLLEELPVSVSATARSSYHPRGRMSDGALPSRAVALGLAPPTGGAEGR